MDLTDYIDSFVEENYGEVSISDTANHFFILGKKYAEEQMMKKAIDTEASLTMSVPSICISLPLGVNVGDKLKVIVIKED